MADHALVTLLTAALVVMGSPGPSTLSATAVGASFGARRAFPYLVGLLLGTGMVLVAVIAGLAGLLLAIPGLAPALTVASALYLLYLAFRIATAPPLSRQGAATAVPAPGTGFLLGVANPKAWLAISAVAGGTMLSASPLVDATLKVAVLGIMVVLIHVFWLMAGVAFTRLLYDPRASRIANIAMALALVITTVFAFV